MDPATFIEDYEPTMIDTFRQEMSMLDPSDGLQRDVKLTIKDIGSGVMKESMLAD